MAYIKCTDLCLGYDGHAVAENINFSVSEGDYLCVVGENGSGKSTLVKTLLGLTPPVSGRVEYSDGFSSGAIGYLPQQTPVQRDFPASVREIVLSGCLTKMGMRPFYGAEEKKRAAVQMERLGITDLADRCYRYLSGGQQQRVLLARALCAADRMILLDEPVAGLDPKVTQEMYDMISRLNAGGLAVIMVSHDIPAAVKYASHILHISHTPLFCGTKRDYVNSDVAKLFLNGGNGDA